MGAFYSFSEELRIELRPKWRKVSSHRRMRQKNIPEKAAKSKGAQGGGLHG